MVNCDTLWHVPAEHAKKVACTCLKEIRNVSKAPLDRYSCSSMALLDCTENKMADLEPVPCDRLQKCPRRHFHSSLVRDIVLTPCDIWLVCF